MKVLNSSWFPLILGMIFLVAFLSGSIFQSSAKEEPVKINNEEGWLPPDINLVSRKKEGKRIHYGRELIMHTAEYFGPKGKIAHITNGMNCQNCHVMAGKKPFGNNFAMVASVYPRYRDRSGKVESVEFRVNDCLERSLNGKRIDSLSKEMKAIVAYIKWVGKDVKQGMKPAGTGTIELPFLNRAADPQKGKTVYANQCSRCHGENGEGLVLPDLTGYQYPPLWGENSYNVSAGLFRLSRFAAFVKYNMPFDLVYSTPLLTDEEAWDVAAFVNSQPRPAKQFLADWPKHESKPPDYPFGPYADNFSEQQHKYGPFGPIKDSMEKIKKRSK